VKILHYTLAVIAGILSGAILIAYPGKVPYQEVVTNPNTSVFPYFLGALLLAGLAGVARFAPNSEDHDRAENAGWVNAALFFLVPLIGTIGASIEQFIKSHQPDGLLELLVFGFGGLVFGFIWLIYSIAMIFYPLFLGFGVALVLPYSALGLYAFFKPSRVAEIAREHAVTETPDELMREKLEKTLRESGSSDKIIMETALRLRELFNVKSALDYKIKERKYRKMEELMKAQEAAIRAKVDLAKAASDLEDAKNND